MYFYFNIRLNAPIFRSDVLVYVPNHNKVAILLFSILSYFILNYNCQTLFLYNLSGSKHTLAALRGSKMDICWI